MDRNTIYYGSSVPLPERIPLRAGPLTLVYEQGDLHTVSLDGHEILRRVYVAIRDRNWGTILPVFSNVKIQADPDRFTIQYDVQNRAGQIDFAWHGEIHGEADGTLTFAMDGAARSTFVKNRIGFCLLHPAGLSGQPAWVEHIDGMREQTRFAVDICADQPVQPFSDLRAIRHEVMPGVWAEVSFTGDSFEMEDQRLWTDASYKTFCTPLSLPSPVEIQEGTRVAQSVTLKLIDERSAENRPARFPHHIQVTAVADRAPVIIKTTRDWKPLPALGVAVASHGADLSEGELGRLRALQLHHLRLELRLSKPDYPARLRQAAQQAAALGMPLEIALAIKSDEAEALLTGFMRLTNELRPNVCGWLVFPEKEPYSGCNPSGGFARLARATLNSYDSTAPLAVGTNTDFVFLKRTRLPLEWMDQVFITLNPQVHAFDNRSILETLEAQPVVVESARRLAQGRPVVVSPITLKPRFNPYATGPQPFPVPGELPPQVDPRQVSLFGAGWTLGSLRAMVLGGAERVTYFETTGWRGVMETEQGSPMPQAFPSILGAVFPLYHVLGDYAEFTGGEAGPLETSAPFNVSALALRHGDHLRYILANHTAEAQEIKLEARIDQFEVRPLDETNIEAAMREPEIFRRETGLRTRAREGMISLHLRPYGLLRVDQYPEK